MRSVIIVNHRSNGLVVSCVRSLLDGTLVPDEIVVVDNDAADGGLKDDLKDHPIVRLLPVDDNPGYAAACELGLASTTGETVAFLNVDITVGTDTFERCVAELEADATIGIVTPRLVRPDGAMDHACHRGLPTAEASLAYKLRLDRVAPRSHRLGRYSMSWLDPLTDHDVEACSGAFMLTRRSMLEAIGGWDTRYRFYGEDLDLCARAIDAGYRVRYLGTASAIHLKGALSHLGTPDASLDTDQLASKRWVQREILASHRLFYDEHLRANTALPLRIAAAAQFRAQALRLAVATRRRP